MVKTTQKLNLPWSAIFSVIVYKGTMGQTFNIKPTKIIKFHLDNTGPLGLIYLRLSGENPQNTATASAQLKVDIAQA